MEYHYCIHYESAKYKISNRDLSASCVGIPVLGIHDLNFMRKQPNQAINVEQTESEEAKSVLHHSPDPFNISGVDNSSELGEAFGVVVDFGLLSLCPSLPTGRL